MEEEKPTAPLIDNLFRVASGKLVSVLVGIFGTHNLELAEDVVQDTLIKALQTWRIKGIPDNPSAWLFTVARNKALDILRKERHRKDFAAEISPLLKSEYSAGETLKELFTETGIEDEQLRMMFICCHPSVPEEAQVAMILKTLCGFSVGEIASAFLTNEETIAKRLYRAREQFREHKIAFDFPTNAEIKERTTRVLLALYLLFNEGYHTARHPSATRDDLVEESLRLGKMLADHPVTRTPETFALVALFCFHASRLHSRVDNDGNLVALRDQNRSEWNHALINKGVEYLQIAASGDQASAYHIEAAIAFEHCSAKNFMDTDWAKIIQLYEWLYQIKPDPLVALNRLIAIAEFRGPAAALEESKTVSLEIQKTYYLFPAALGDWYASVRDHPQARRHFEIAITLTKSPAEKKLFEKKLAALQG